MLVKLFVYSIDAAELRDGLINPFQCSNMALAVSSVVNLGSNLKVVFGNA